MRVSVLQHHVVEWDQQDIHAVYDILSETTKGLSLGPDRVEVLHLHTLAGGHYVASTSVKMPSGESVIVGGPISTSLAESVLVLLQKMCTDEDEKKKAAMEFQRLFPDLHLTAATGNMPHKSPGVSILHTSFSKATRVLR